MPCRNLPSLLAAFALACSVAAAQCPAPVAPRFTDFDTGTTLGGGLCAGPSGTLPAGFVSGGAPLWQVWRGATPSSGTGPDVDHSSGTALGRYLYVEASCPSGSAPAILDLPCTGVAGIASPAIGFWYHLYGAGSGTLKVEELVGTLWLTRWMQSGDQGNAWHHANVALTGSAGTVRVRFHYTLAGSAGDVALDDIDLGPAPAQWQTNSAAASLSIDGTQTHPHAGPVEVVDTVCTSSTIAIGSTNAGQGWELAFNLAAARPRAQGAAVTAGGQIVNVDLLDPTTQYAFGQTLPPFPGPLVLPLASPVPVPVLSAQMLVVDPASAEGFALSAAIRWRVTPPALSLTLGDEAVATVSLSDPALCGQAPASVALYGTTYTAIDVHANGVVSAPGSAAAGFNVSVASFNARPSAGFYTDLQPNVAGSVTVSVPAANRLRVEYRDVPYFDESAGVRFAVEFDAVTGAILLDGLQGIAPNPRLSGIFPAGDSMILGITPGPSATAAPLTPFTGSGAGNPFGPLAPLLDFVNQASVPLPSPVLLPSLGPGGLNRLTFTPMSGSPNYSWAGS